MTMRSLEESRTALRMAYHQRSLSTSYLVAHADVLGDVEKVALEDALDEVKPKTETAVEHRSDRPME